MDRFSKLCLLSIVLLLAVIALRQTVNPQPVHADVYYEYTAFDTIGPEVVSELNTRSKDGWELVNFAYGTDRSNPYMAVMRRPLREGTRPFVPHPADWA